MALNCLLGLLGGLALFLYGMQMMSAPIWKAAAGNQMKQRSPGNADHHPL